MRDRDIAVVRYRTVQRFLAGQDLEVEPDSRRQLHEALTGRLIGVADGAPSGDEGLGRLARSSCRVWECLGNQTPQTVWTARWHVDEGPVLNSHNVTRPICRDWLDQVPNRRFCRPASNKTAISARTLHTQHRTTSDYTSLTLRMSDLLSSCHFLQHSSFDGRRLHNDCVEDRDEFASPYLAAETRA